MLSVHPPIVRCAHWVSAALCAWWLTGASPAWAGTPIALYRSYAGNIQYTGIAGTLRAQPNSGNSCALLSSSSAPLAGIPAGATVRGAFLYWAGSGSGVDATVTFSTPSGPTSITASRTFTETFSLSGTDYDFFSGFADVTAQVAAAGNGTYGLSGLSVNAGAPHCSVSAVVAGWSVIVIYEHASQPLRVVNLFDGFEFFRGSQISLTPNNFVIPTAPIDGQLSHLTWEGDVENSAPLGGFSEALRFEGNILTDAQNPPSNQFNSTVNTIPTSASYGVDFDVYDISPYLSAGQTSGNSLYSSGGDLVLLSAEVFSVTNTPVADLQISKTHSGDFGVGVPETYTLIVTNSGPSTEPGPVTVTDTLPAGLTYSASSGTGWGCAPGGATVTCTHAGPLAAGASLPPLLLEVVADASAVPSVTNTASVAGTLFDNVAGNNSASDPTTVVVPDLSTSTKDVVDLDFGDAEPGDVLRYTIALTENAGAEATGVQVTDDMPAGVTGFAVTGLPPGAVDASVPGGGANGTGFLDVQNLTVPAGGTAQIEFEVAIVPATPPGTVIANSATIANPLGPGATPAAPDVVVSASQVPGSGIKELYLYGAPGLELSRAPPTGLPPSAAVGNVVVDKTTPPVVWTLADALAAPLTLGAGGSGGNFPVELWLRRGNTSPGGVARTLQVDVASAALGPIGTATQAVTVTGIPQPFAFTIVPSLALPATLPASDRITLTVTNVTPGGGARRVLVFPGVLPAGHSHVRLNADPVVSVDSVAAYDAAFPSGATPPQFAPGATAHLRAVVSDPFGSFDIRAATLELRDPTGAPVLAGQAMAEVADSGADTKTYEFAFTIPGAAPSGVWEARVVADEGLEGTIQDLGLGTFTVAGTPDVIVMKSVTVLEDPVGGITNPKAIPGARLEYTVTVTNSGTATGPATDVTVTDDLDAHIGAGRLAFHSDAYGPGSGIRVTAPNIGGGAPTPLSNAADADAGDWSANTVTVTGIALDPGETAIVVFQVFTQ